MSVTFVTSHIAHPHSNSCLPYVNHRCKCCSAGHCNAYSCRCGIKYRQ